MTFEYLNKYILKIQGPIKLRLWDEFSTSKLKYPHYIGFRIELVMNWLEGEYINIGGKGLTKK